MRFLYALLPSLCLSALLQAQNSPCPNGPAALSTLSHQRHKVCLSDQELIAHITTQKPIGAPGLLEPHMNSHGTIVACLCFARTGKVTDVKILSGPAIMQQSVLESVRDWTFRSVEKSGRLYGGCGTLRIRIDMNDLQVSTTIGK